jgi:hypothetical protein
VIPAIKTAGLLIDSSVVQGLYEKSLRWYCDFRTAESNFGYWWTTPDDVCQSGPDYEQILELPVYSRMQPYITNLRWSKLRAELKRRKLESHYPGIIKQARGIRSTHKLTEVLQKLASIHPVTVDFCKMNARSMIMAVEEVILTNGYRNDETERIVPVVLIGHSKDFWNDEQLDSFLSTIVSLSKYKGEIKLSTFSDVAEKLIKPSEKYVLNTKTDRTVPVIIVNRD